MFFWERAALELSRFLVCLSVVLYATALARKRGGTDVAARAVALSALVLSLSAPIVRCAAPVAPLFLSFFLSEGFLLKNPHYCQTWQIPLSLLLLFTLLVSAGICLRTFNESARFGDALRAFLIFLLGLSSSILLETAVFGFSSPGRGSTILPLLLVTIICSLTYFGACCLLLQRRIAVLFLWSTSAVIIAILALSVIASYSTAQPLCRTLIAPGGTDL